MARLVWAFVVALDLTRFYDQIKAREGEAGRPAADPAVQLALWLLATIEGIGSARALDRLSGRHLAYRWLCCGVPVNYHGLADFRVTHAEVLDELLTQSLVGFMAEGFIDVEEILVDGTKVKASAGKSSFKRVGKLDATVAAAKLRVEKLKAEIDADPAASSKRREAARLRAARELEARAAKAKQTLAEIEKERQKRAKRSPKEMAAKKEPRASLTDPEARRMRFADGAIRPAYNVQLAVTSDHGFITAVQATDRRNDTGLARPMLEESERRTGACVKRLLADTGYACVDDIAALGIANGGHRDGLCPTAGGEGGDQAREPCCSRREAGQGPEAVKAWRERMGNRRGGDRDETARPDRAGQCAIKEPWAWLDARPWSEESPSHRITARPGA